MNSPENEHSRTGHAEYWSASLRVVQLLLLIWAVLSLGCGILFRDWLDAALPSVGGAPFGFWMAQQGSIIGFLLLLVLYMVLMNRVDNRFGYTEGDDA